jgi:polysaccharide pyruvyl transferase WcaK-like protein
LLDGWYGTETLGDKTILGGILGYAVQPDKKARLLSMVPFYSKTTIEELSFADQIIIEQKKPFGNLRAVLTADIYIVAGGPLMEIDDMYGILINVIWARLFQKKVVILGCGIGPFDSKRFKILTHCILRLADTIILRDENSIYRYPSIIGKIEYSTGIDPAVLYCTDAKPDRTCQQSKKVLIALRDWPESYCSLEYDYYKIREKFESEMIAYINGLFDDGYGVTLFPMNTFVLGNDDREYLLRFAKRLHVMPDIITQDLTVKRALQMFAEHAFVVGMRYHSVIWAAVLNIPFVGIDYDTRGGKTTAFLEMVKADEYGLNITEVDRVALDEITERIKKQHYTIDGTVKACFNQKLKAMHNLAAGVLSHE